jgi:hypothetical protein
MKRLVCGGGIIFLLAFARLFAQDRPYLIPQTVYVGDRATLVLPLPHLHAQEGGAKDGTFSLDPKLFPVPASASLVLHRLTLERRAAGSRLLVEFTAYAPGVLELPPVEIGGERFTGLSVEISSLISSDGVGSDGAGSVLSPPAPPLAVPGASLLLYGTMGALALIFALLLWGTLWGRGRLAAWFVVWKRRRLIISMRIIEKRLRKRMLKDEGRQEALALLSSEFRAFLSLFTGENCRAMTALELGCLPPLLPGEAETGAVPQSRRGSSAQAPGGEFLGPFFRRCDELRFSGAEVAADDVLASLDNLRNFLDALDRAARGNGCGTGAAA